MKGGRKPTPTFLRLIQGNPSKRPINLFEPRVALLKTTPEPPRVLSASEAKEWKRLAPQLIEAQLLTALDLDMLAVLCATLATIADASRAIKREGATITTPTGQRKQNPWVGIRNTAMRNLSALSAEFGLTPSARSRIKVAPAAKDGDPFGDYMRSVPTPPAPPKGSA